MIRHLCLSAALVALFSGHVLTAEPAPAAAPPVAFWLEGEGTIAGSPAANDQAIPAGITVTTGVKPAALELVGAPDSLILLGPGSSIRLVVEPGAKPMALVELLAGTVEVDLPNRGTWGGLRVLSAVLNVQVAGTLFIVERGRRDTDFVAVLRGKVKASLRTEVAKALGKANDPAIELTVRQGLSATASGGISAVEPVLSRPTIGSTTSIPEQTRVPDPEASSWNENPPVIDQGPPIDIGNIIAVEIGTDSSSNVVDQVLNVGLSELGNPPPPPAP